MTHHLFHAAFTRKDTDMRVSSITRTPALYRRARSDWVREIGAVDPAAIEGLKVWSLLVVNG